MNPWLETLGVLLLALAGCYAGKLISRLRRPWWLAAWALPFVLILAVALTRWREELNFVAPFSWIVAGRLRFAVLAVAGALVLTIPLSRIPRRRDRRWISVFLSVLIGYAVTPFLVPAVIRGRLLGLETRFAPGDVCLQSNGYTCGPAAAVTALRRLGVRAEEGDLAVLAHTTPTGGTPADCLVLAVRERHGPEGVSAEYLGFEGVDHLEDVLQPALQLPLEREASGAAPAPDDGGVPSEPCWSVAVIAVVKHSFLVDHYVAVLEVTPEEVIVGDPLIGKRRLSREEFLEVWRRSGIVLRRAVAGSGQ